MQSLSEKEVGRQEMNLAQYLKLKERVFNYVERFFARQKNTTFPTVRQVARAMGVRQSQVIEIVEDDNRLMLTYYNVDHHIADGDRFVESLGV